jgi:hypothetical protein
MRLVHFHQLRRKKSYKIRYAAKLAQIRNGRDFISLILLVFSEIFGRFWNQDLSLFFSRCDFPVQISTRVEAK